MRQQRLPAAIVFGEFPLAQQRMNMAMAGVAEPEDRRQPFGSIEAAPITCLAMQGPGNQVMTRQGRGASAQLATSGRGGGDRACPVMQASLLVAALPHN